MDAINAPAQWYVYMLRTAAGLIYTGISTDPARRLREHQEGRRGARSLRGKGPMTLLWQTQAPDRASASVLEARIKRLSRARKLALIAGRESVAALLNAP